MAPPTHAPSSEPLVLKALSRTQGNNEALKDGSVRPDGVRLDFEEVPVLVDGFRRMVRGLEFDVAEMAVTTYLCARAHGTPFTALPVFLVRGFHHGAAAVAASGEVEKPSDLEGRRVGVSRGYTVTTGVWVRGILQDEYGVDLDRVTWVPSGDEHVTAYRPPSNVEPMRPGGDLETMVAEGELAAAVGIAASRPEFVPLIPEPREAAFAALRRRRLYPINHLVVVRNDVLDAHPGLAAALFEAFGEAKRRYVARLEASEIANPTATDAMYRRVMETTGDDPLPYGIAPNRDMLDELVRHAVRQRILDRPPALEEMFAAGTHDLTA
ncbi:MAG: ABC transporter substrate-binding protein [Actinomycetes bacterium]